MSRYFTKTLASLEPYTPGEQLKIADIVKLNANENPYPPAPMDMKKNVQMVRHDNIRIHGDIVVNRFRAAN